MAGLRAAITEAADWDVQNALGWARGPALTDEEKSLRGKAQDALAAELAAVEARLERFKRFVRAFDQFNSAADYLQWEAEMIEARAAITAEDLAS